MKNKSEKACNFPSVSDVGHISHKKVDDCTVRLEYNSQPLIYKQKVEPEAI